MTRTAFIATPLLVILLGWFGPVVLDDHQGEWDQAADLEAAQQQAEAQARFEQAAQLMCGPQAAWSLLEDGSVQCRTKRGAKTITAQVDKEPSQ